MKRKTSEQLKGAVKNFAKQYDLNPNDVLQMCLFEYIIEKLSHTRYADNFIIKGGLLTASLIGCAMRTTKDMDTTIHGIHIDKDSLQAMLEEILSTPLEDDNGISFTLQDLTPIRPDVDYEDYCATVQCDFGKIHAVMHIDITSGDTITPEEIQYAYPQLLDNTSSIPVMAYTVETILAEKFHAITTLATDSTRAKDFYDIYILHTMFGHKIIGSTLRDAIVNTFQQRHVDYKLNDYQDVAKELPKSRNIQAQWAKFQKNNSYARGITLEQTIEAYKAVGECLDIADFKPQRPQYDLGMF